MPSNQLRKFVRLSRGRAPQTPRRRLSAATQRNYPSNLARLREGLAYVDFGPRNRVTTLADVRERLAESLQENLVGPFLFVADDDSETEQGWCADYE